MVNLNTERLRHREVLPNKERKVAVYKYAENKLAGRPRKSFDPLKNITKDLNRKMKDWDVKEMTSVKAGKWVIYTLLLEKRDLP